MYDAAATLRFDGLHRAPLGGVVFGGDAFIRRRDAERVARSPDDVVRLFCFVLLKFHFVLRFFLRFESGAVAAWRRPVGFSRRRRRRRVGQKENLDGELIALATICLGRVRHPSRLIEWPAGLRAGAIQCRVCRLKRVAGNEW